jgi:hypothetical protein
VERVVMAGERVGAKEVGGMVVQVGVVKGVEGERGKEGERGEEGWVVVGVAGVEMVGVDWEEAGMGEVKGAEGAREGKG